MQPNMNKTARDYELSFSRGLSQGAINGRATGDVLSLAAEFRPVQLRGTSRAPVSLAPGFSRVALGRGIEKTVLTVFLKRTALSKYQ